MNVQDRISAGQPASSRTIRTERMFASLSWRSEDRYRCTLWIVGSQGGKGSDTDVDTVLELTYEEICDWRDFLDAVLWTV